MFHTYCKYLLASGLASTVISCSNTRFLKEGQMLYTGAEVKIENDTISKQEKKIFSQHWKITSGLNLILHFWDYVLNYISTILPKSLKKTKGLITG